MRSVGAIPPRHAFIPPALGILSALAVLAAVPLRAEQGQGLTVPRAAICTSVRDREPVGEGSTFPPTVGRLYCYTRIQGATEPTHVTHVWFHGEREVHRMDLEVAGPSWRTWTYKTIPPEWTGSWRVDIEDANGVIIYSIPFTIAGEDEPERSPEERAPEQEGTP